MTLPTILFLATLHAPPARAADLIVGKTHTDLAAALAAAAANDRILLPPGIHTGTFAIGTADLIVEGVDPDDPPEIHPYGEDAARDGVFLVDGLALTVRHAILDGDNVARLARVINAGELHLDDVEVRNGSHASASGGALFVQGATLTLTGCNVHDNATLDDNGGAIYTANSGGSATLVVSGSRFENNSARSSGGAIRAGGTAVVTDSTFVDNVANAEHGGAIWSSATSTVEDNRFCGNTAGGRGGAVVLSAISEDSTVDRNVFFANIADGAGAIYFANEAMGSNNDFIANEATVGGAAVLFDGSGEVTLYNSLAVDHVSGDNIFGRNNGTLTIDHVGYAGNTIAEVGATNVDQPTPPLSLDPKDALYVRYVAGDCEGSDLRLRPESAAAVAGKGTQEGYGGGAFRDHLGSQGVCAAGTEVAGDGIDQDCDGVDDCYLDEDGDGFAGTASAPGSDLSCLGAGEFLAPEDCDDDNALVHPGATEIAGDGVDADCDGLELCFVDEDGDGHGAGVPEGIDDLTCGTSGWSSEDGDCDDDDGDVGPHVLETSCNGVDDDCDPVTEDDADEDGDGYLGCTEDCDDTDAYVSPAAPEQCDNGVDDDCDGMVDEEAEVRPWYLDADGDGFGFGNELQAVVSCQRPSEAHVLQGGDCDDADAAVYPGAEERCDGVDNDCDGVVDLPSCERGDPVGPGQGAGYAGCACGGSNGPGGWGWVAFVGALWVWRVSARTPRSHR